MAKVKAGSGFALAKRDPAPPREARPWHRVDDIVATVYAAVVPPSKRAPSRARGRGRPTEAELAMREARTLAGIRKRNGFKPRVRLGRERMAIRAGRRAARAGRRRGVAIA